MGSFSRFLAVGLFFQLALFSAMSALGEPGRNGMRQNAIPVGTQVEPRVKESTDRDKPLPETDTIKFDGKVEDLFGKFHFSNAIDLKDPQWVIGKDPILAELSLMDRFLDRVQKGDIPADEAHMIVTRYHLADDRVFARIQRAAKLKVNCDVITDLNDSVDAKFKSGEKSISDFTDKRIKANTSPNGRMYQKLLDLGFTHGTEKKKPRLGVYSQPLFNKEKEDGELKIFDIMHEKAVVVAHIKKGKIIESEATAGSANMVAHGAAAKATKDADVITRVNIVREITHPELAARRVEHALALRETFAKGGMIDDSPVENFLRVDTRNGFVETGFTNGRNNLNDRIAALLLHGTPGMTQELVNKGYDKGVESYFERVAKEFGGWTIDEIREFEFVNTHSPTRKAEQHLFEGNKDVKKLGLYDAKFNEVRGWGFPPIQVGVDLLRTMGGTVSALKKEISDRMETQVYLRGIPGIRETDLDGPPLARFLLHTKTYVIRGRKADGTPVTVIFDGSLNKSNHKENAEDQDMIVIYGKSKLADAFFDIPKLLLKAEPQHFSLGHVELLRDTFARFTGHSPLEVTNDFAVKVGLMISRGEIEEASDEIEKMSKQETQLDRPPKASVIADRVDRFRKFLRWHKKTFPKMYGRDDNFYLRKLLDVASLMTHADVNQFQAAGELRWIFWAPGATPADQDRWAKEAWEFLGRKDEYPPKRDSGDKPEPKEGSVLEEETHTEQPKKKGADVTPIKKPSAKPGPGGDAAAGGADCDKPLKKVAGRRRG